jgi:hypothetical protein
MEPLTTSGPATEAEKAPVEAEKDLQRLRALLRGLESELQLSSFEFAVLTELCEQQQARVLAVLRGEASVDEKRQFLLHLLRPGASETEEKALKASKTKEKSLKVSKTKREIGREESKLQSELVAKKVAAIGRKVFSPHVQTQVLALAEGVKGSWSSGRFKDTVELLELVEKLLDKHVLPEEHGAHLLELALNENRVLLSALQSYRSDGSWADLQATAKRLAALGCDPPEPIASKTRKGKSPRRLAKQGSVAAKKRGRNAAAATPSAVSVVRSLHAQHMLTSLELDIVQALVAQGDSQVLQLLRGFERSDHRDVSALRDALVGVVEEITVELGDEEKAAAAFARGVDDAVREQEEGENSDDDSDSLGWQRHLSFLLGQWQAQHQLTPADASTLREMVAQKHNLLESAYEVFAGDGDGSELLDTLQRVARLQRQIEQSRAGQNVSGAEALASGLGLEDVVRQMQRRGAVQAGEAAGLLMLFAGGNEALQAANEAFQADGDVRELEETLLLVVKHARFGGDAEEEAGPVEEGQAVSRLLAEYGRSGRLELWQIQLLVSLLKSHDPRLLAAVDVYNEDQDAEELLETLEILVELAAWERHRRAMVHDWIAPLARSGKLPRGGAERLVQLVKARDDRVVAALVVFLSDGNKEELVDTLARIACLEAMKLQHVEADASQNDAKEGHLVLALLRELEDTGVMSGAEREQVEELVCGGEPRMLAAMDVLAATHDAEDFADTARRILAHPKEEEAEREADEAGPAVSSPKSGSPSAASEETGAEDGAPKDDEPDLQVEAAAEEVPPLSEDQSEEKEDASAEQLEPAESDEPDRVEEQVVSEDSEQCGEADEAQGEDVTKGEAAEEVGEENGAEEEDVEVGGAGANAEPSGGQQQLDADEK